MKKGILLLVLSVIFGQHISYAQISNLMLDNKKLLLSTDIRKEVFNINAFTLSDSILKNGRQSFRAEVKSSNFGDRGIRSEIAFRSERSAENWYGVSIFAPSNYFPDTEPEIVTQWHDVPDTELGEGWVSPSLDLRVQDGRWYFDVRWDTAKVTRQGSWIGSLIKDLGTVKLEDWTDWIFHIRFSYNSDGLIEIYRNGVKVFERNGPNGYNDKRHPYWKIGIYKWPYKNHNSLDHLFNERILYYNDIRKADSTANFNKLWPVK